MFDSISGEAPAAASQRPSEPSGVEQAEKILEAALRRLDPEILDPSFARRLLESFSKIEKLAAAGKTLVAGRVASTGAWKVTGDRSAAHWIARKTGSSVGHAIGVIETAERLSELPATEKAVREGKLSEIQAKEIASAAAASPAAETGLLRAADFEGFNGLKERCARVKAAAAKDEADRHEALHRSRYLRHWSDRDGAFRLEGRFTPERGAVLLAALEPFKHQVFEAARKHGRRDPYDALAADALIGMAEDSRSAAASQAGQAGGNRPPAVVHVRVDHDALSRGTTEPGEICEIPGVGPVPVATARALAADAYLSVIVTRGADIRAVVHAGRTISARLRTALLDRDASCVVPGCDEKDRLEIDHIVPISEGGGTTLDNLARLCQWHHYLKTHQGYRLRGEPGGWMWEHPPHKIAPGEKPPPGHLIA